MQLTPERLDQLSEAFYDAAGQPPIDGYIAEGWDTVHESRKQIIGAGVEAVIKAYEEIDNDA